MPRSGCPSPRPTGAPGLLLAPTALPRPALPRPGPTFRAAAAAAGPGVGPRPQRGATTGAHVSEGNECMGAEAPPGRLLCGTVLGVRGAADELGGPRGPSLRRPLEVWPRGVTPAPGCGRTGLSRHVRRRCHEGAADPRDQAGPSREGSDGNAAAPSRLSACQQRETAPAAGPGAAAPRRAALQKPLRRKAERSAGHAVPPQHRRALSALLSSRKNRAERSGAGGEGRERAVCA